MGGVVVVVAVVVVGEVLLRGETALRLLGVLEFADVGRAVGREVGWLRV